MLILAAFPGVIKLGWLPAQRSKLSKVNTLASVEPETVAGVLHPHLLRDKECDVIISQVWKGGHQRGKLKAVGFSYSSKITVARSDIGTQVGELVAVQVLLSPS